MAVQGLPQLADSRRLTGANLFWDRPAAVIDISGDGDLGPFIRTWEQHAGELLLATGHTGEQLTHRQFTGGASLLISAPIDALYSMCELNEAAFHRALGAPGAVVPAGESSEIGRLRALFTAEANPPLLALQAAAQEHGAPFLWDDDAVSVGHGTHAITWPPRALPDPAELDWEAAKAVPVALVTGTNGKSTTVRMAASILAAAGLRAGLSSTDWIRVGDVILDRGDYSGTGGARTLLRHPDTEVAVLETARGGLLRRGLGVDRASASVITNVAADHLGDYGIHSVPELIEAKFIVRRALGPDAPLILNADDPGIVQRAASLQQHTWWFTLDPELPLVTAHVAAGGTAAVLRDGRLQLLRGERVDDIVHCSAIPATLSGAARHNVHNALAALLLCSALGVADEHLGNGLAAFRGDAEDNPGRGNWFEGNGVRILVDFAHNEHGVRAVADMVSGMPARRRIVLLSQAGDRTDADIHAMVRTACRMQPGLLLTCDLPGYERGRPPGEVPRLIHGFALDEGMAEDAVRIFPDPVAAVSAALETARQDDLLVLLALSQRDRVLQLVRDFTRR